MLFTLSPKCSIFAEFYAFPTYAVESTLDCLILYLYLYLYLIASTFICCFVPRSMLCLKKADK